MNTDALIKKISGEIAKVKDQVQSAEGMARLQEVAAKYEGEYRLIWSDDLLKKISERPAVTLHPSGLGELDALIGGFREQQLVTVSAHSKHGKTQFGLFLMEQLEHLAPVMIPLEQSNEEILIQRKENGYTIPKFLSPEKLAARVTVDWIEERVVEGIAKHNTKLVLIDHLGYIDDFGENSRYAKENLAYRIQVMMQGIKTLAKKWNVIIVLLVHIAQADEGKPPSNQDLKGSSSILQESDLVFLLWRKNDVQNKIRTYTNKTLLTVSANRRTGSMGNIGLAFNTSTGRYEEESTWLKDMERTAKEFEFNDIY